MSVAEPLLLGFSLAGGFAFLQYCHKYKHRWDALEWERNLFEAALVGVGLFVVVRGGVWLIERRWGSTAVQVHDALHQILPFPYAGSLLAALALAFILAWSINRRVGEDVAIREAVQRHCGQLLILLHHAGQHALPVMLTMTNRKVYVGFVMVSPSPKYRYTKILPTASGHRTSETLEVPSFDTHYWPVYEDLRRRRAAGEIVGVKEDDFGIVLPVDQICSANIFDDDTYGRYFRRRPEEQLALGA